MKGIAVRILLAISGPLLFLIGTMMLIIPHAFYASNGVVLGDQVSLLSEIRAPGGLLIACAVIMVLGVSRLSMTRPALVLAALVYGTFGVARLFSFVIDGIPANSLVAATFLELIIGALSLILIPGTKPEGSTAEDKAAERITLARRKYGID